jgi:seryl-tRNA synthetase
MARPPWTVWCFQTDHCIRAIINYGLEFLSERDFIPLQTPQLMLREQMAKTAQLSQFDEELYKVTGDQADKYLIAVRTILSGLNP